VNNTRTALRSPHLSVVQRVSIAQLVDKSPTLQQKPSPSRHIGKLSPQPAHLVRQNNWRQRPQQSQLPVHLVNLLFRVLRLLLRMLHHDMSITHTLCTFEHVCMRVSDVSRSTCTDVCA
jgi:hypothetical protein